MNNESNLSDILGSTNLDQEAEAHVEKVVSDEAYWAYLDEVEYHLEREGSWDSDVPPEDFE